MVVLIAGGNGRNNVEVYSPDGRCSQDLGGIGVLYISPFMGLINGKITMCSNFEGYFDCAVLNTTSVTWSPFPNTKFSHPLSPGSSINNNFLSTLFFCLKKRF